MHTEVCLSFQFYVNVAFSRIVLLIIKQKTITTHLIFFQLNSG